MKTDKKIWKKKVEALIARRAKGTQDNAHCESIVSDYGRHLRSFVLGKTLLDVGCGDQTIRKILEIAFPLVKYIGVDAFPVLGTLTTKLEIENTPEVEKFLKIHGRFDNVLCFAMLDSSYDLERATKNMKRLAETSVVFLTGIDIEPDEFHTHRITKELLDSLMLTPGWMIRMSNFLTPHVLLIEYARTGEPEVEEKPSGKTSATV